MTEAQTHLFSPIAWVGGKARLAKGISHIIDQVPHDTYVEPFAGGASVFFYKPPSQKEVLNDVNTNLMLFYQKLQKESSPCSVYNNKSEFLQSKTKVESGQWDVCDYIRLNKNSFAGGMRTFGSITTGCDHKTGNCHVGKFNQRHEEIRQRLKKAHLHNMDYTKMIQKYDSPTSFFYADPPYEGNSSRMYQTELSPVSPDRISQSFCNIKGKVLISFNDSPEVRKAFENKCGYHLKQLEVFYSANNKYLREKKPELLIANFPLK